MIDCHHLDLSQTKAAGLGELVNDVEIFTILLVDDDSQQLTKHARSA